METLDLSRLVFDTILVQQSGAGFNEITVSGFLKLPIDVRISLIMEKRIRFLLDEKIVSPYEASASLEAARLAIKGNT